jgi:hypothetical protein
LNDKRRKERNNMEKIETKEVLTSTTLENELAKGHNYGSGYRSKSWFIVIGEKAMTDLNLNYENIADFIQKEFKILYACWDEEISDNNKKHMHLYMELDNKVRFSTIQKRLTGAHIDRRYGSPAEARQYIEKPVGMLFKGKEKSHTVVKPMQELGSFEPFKHLKGYRKEIEFNMSSQDKLDYVLENFDSWEEVIAWDIHFATTHKAALLSAFEQKRYNEFINSDSVVKHTNAQGKTSISVNRQVYYLCGPAGCGKTEGIKRKFGDDEVSQITNLKSDMKFDDYRNNSVLLFDEFYSQLTMQQMLNLLDNKITKLPCRYENKFNISNTIILTSNNRFEQQYVDEQTDNPETYTAFCRRFTGGIWEMYQCAASDEEALLPVYQHTGKRFIAMKQGPVGVKPPVETDSSVQWVSYVQLWNLKGFDNLRGKLAIPVPF